MVHLSGPHRIVSEGKIRPQKRKGLPHYRVVSGRLQKETQITNQESITPETIFKGVIIIFGISLAFFVGPPESIYLVTTFVCWHIIFEPRS